MKLELLLPKYAWGFSSTRCLLKSGKNAHVEFWNPWAVFRIHQGQISPIPEFQIPSHEVMSNSVSLTIIPRALMGSEPLAHEAEGWMDYWLGGHDTEGNNCFSKTQLVGKKHRDKTTLASKTRLICHCFGFKAGAFRY